MLNFSPDVTSNCIALLTQQLNFFLRQCLSYLCCVFQVDSMICVLLVFKERP